MALINCPECDKEISDMCKECPSCGYPLEKEVENISKQNNSIFGKNSSKKIIIGIVLGVIFLSAAIFGGYQIWYKGTLSPIEDISKQIYTSSIEILDEYLDPDMKNKIKDAYQEDESNGVFQNDAIRKLDKLIGSNSTEAEKLLAEKIKSLLKMHDKSIKEEIFWDEAINMTENYTIRSMAISSKQEIANKYNLMIESGYRGLMESKNIEDLKKIKL